MLQYSIALSVVTAQGRPQQREALASQRLAGVSI